MVGGFMGFDQCLSVWSVIKNEYLSGLSTVDYIGLGGVAHSPRKVVLSNERDYA